MLEDEPEKIPDTEGLLLQLRELLDTARSMPLSASVMVNREEFGEILQDAIDGLPEEIRQARWLLKERDEVLQRADREAERIIDVARVRAERMVERTEVVREARRTAEDVVDEAGRVAAQMRLEAEDYVDRKLAALRGRARPDHAAGGEGPGAAVGARADARGPARPRGRGSRASLLRPGRVAGRPCVPDPHAMWVSDAPPNSVPFEWVWAGAEIASDLLRSGILRAARRAGPAGPSEPVRGRRRGSEQARSRPHSPAGTQASIMPSISTTLRIPLAAALRHPGNARPVTPTVTLGGLGDGAAEIDARHPGRPRPRPRADPEGIVVRGDAHRDLDRGVQPLPRARQRRRSPSTSTSCSRPQPARGRDLPARRRRHRPRADGARRAAARAAAGPAVPARLRRPVRDLRRQPQRARLRLRDRRARPPLGGAPVARDLTPRSNEECCDGRSEAQDESFVDPLAQIRQHAAGAERALAVPELRSLEAPAHGVRQLWSLPRPAGSRRRLTTRRSGDRRSAGATRDAGDRARRDGRRSRARGDRRGRPARRGRARRRRAARRASPTRSRRTCPAARAPARVEVLAATEVIAMDDEPAVRRPHQEGLVARARRPGGQGRPGARARRRRQHRRHDGRRAARLRPHPRGAPARDRGAAARCSAPTGRSCSSTAAPRSTPSPSGSSSGRCSAASTPAIRLGVDEPTVALLSNGEEPGKGDALRKAA